MLCAPCVWRNARRPAISPVEVTSESIQPMPLASTDQPRPTILLIGASRGLGHAMVAEFLKKGWNVVGTVRGGKTRTLLHDLADDHHGRVEIEVLDICEPDQLAALRDRLSGRQFDMLFVNAGTANRNPSETIGEVSTEEFRQPHDHERAQPDAGSRGTGTKRSRDGAYRGDVIRTGQHRQQRDRSARALSRQQGGPQHVHAELCRPPCRDGNGPWP